MLPPINGKNVTQGCTAGKVDERRRLRFDGGLPERHRSSAERSSRSKSETRPDAAQCVASDDPRSREIPTTFKEAPNASRSERRLFGFTDHLPIALVQEADRLGFHSAWTAEAYGSDAVTPATWNRRGDPAAEGRHRIMQMPARTPAMTAMTATDARPDLRRTISARPRTIGPQVVEGAGIDVIALDDGDRRRDVEARRLLPPPPS